MTWLLCGILAAASPSKICQSNISAPIQTYGCALVQSVDLGGFADAVIDGKEIVDNFISKIDQFSDQIKGEENQGQVVFPNTVVSPTDVGMCVSNDTDCFYSLSVQTIPGMSRIQDDYFFRPMVAYAVVSSSTAVCFTRNRTVGGYPLTQFVSYG